jgi:hypothetical protein
MLWRSASTLPRTAPAAWRRASAVRGPIPAGALLVATIAAGSAVAAAPGQTARPGELTKGETWVLNRTRDEAISVAVREFSTDEPVHMYVTNGDPNGRTPTPLRVQVAASAWTYRTERIPMTTGDPVAALNALGAQGWETTGTAWPVDGGSTMVFLLKRAR